MAGSPESGIGERPVPKNQRSQLALGLIDISRALFSGPDTNFQGRPFSHRGITYSLLDSSDDRTYKLFGQRHFSGDEDRRKEMVIVRTSKTPNSLNSFFSFYEIRDGEILETHSNSEIAARRIREFLGFQTA